MTRTTLLCLGALAIGASFVLVAAIPAPQEPAPFYYYWSDSIRLQPAPDLISGQLLNPADSVWLRAEVQRTAPINARLTVPRGSRGRFSLVATGVNAAPQIRSLATALLASGRLRAVYPGYRTRSGDPFLLTGRVVVMFNAGVSAAQVDSIVVANGLSLDYASRDPEFTYWVFNTKPSERDVLALADRLHESEMVALATPDFVGAAHVHYTPSDAYFGELSPNTQNRPLRNTSKPATAGERCG